MFPSCGDIDNATLQFDLFGDHYLITIAAARPWVSKRMACMVPELGVFSTLENTLSNIGASTGATRKYTRMKVRPLMLVSSVE